MSERPSIWPGAALAVLLAAMALVPVALGEETYNRTRLTVWASLILAAPALGLMVRYGGQNSIWESHRALWRGWWSAAYLMFLLHMVWGFGLMFDGEFASVLIVQGRFVGLSNFALLAVWSVSAAWAWIPSGGAFRLHAFASLFLLVSGIVSTLLFGHGPSKFVGAAVLFVIAGAGCARIAGLYSREPS